MTAGTTARERLIGGVGRNVVALGFVSLLTDVSSEMLVYVIPLFLANVLAASSSVIGLIEGIVESASALLRLVSGAISDRLGRRRLLVGTGYSTSVVAKALYLVAASWPAVLLARLGDRVGKGIRTAPRDALVADSVPENQRGLAFGFHRAADTAGAMVGLIIALLVVWLLQARGPELKEATFRTLVLVSLIPAVLAVISLALGAQDVPVTKQRAAPKFAFRTLGKPFMVFCLIVGIFTLGNSADAFLVLRAQERGLTILGVLGMLITFNLIYTLIATPAGSLSDRIGRRKLIIGGWLAYALIYLGFGLAQTGVQIWALYALYGVYYGMAYGTANAMVADLVPAEVGGTAYGTYNAVIGILVFPASVIAGVLWQGIGAWPGFGASAPFLFGGALALLAAALMAWWLPRVIAAQASR